MIKYTKKHCKIIRDCVNRNSANLRLAFVEASVEISISNLKNKLTIDQVKSLWYNKIKYSDRVFSTRFQNVRLKNTKTCQVRTTK